RDGARMPFDENRLRAGMERALEKRPVSTVEIDRVVNEIKLAMVGLGEREVRSEQLGEWLMAALRELDAVAYVRFASVYRSFEDVQAFL
ncbi:transcriptional repressor NrdR, partial [Enterococcus hirae]